MRNKITINKTDEDDDAIAKITRWLPLASQHLIVKAAMRDGLERMAADRRYAKERVLEEHQAARGGE